MSANVQVDHLDDQAVLRILNELTQEIRDGLPSAQTTVVRSEDEARNALAALIAAYTNETDVESTAIVATDQEAARVGRELLKLLLDDEAVSVRVEQLIAEPPQDTQMSVELAIAGAIVLGALISWLQTKVHLRVTRKEGKTEFEFDLQKETTDASLIKEVLEPVKTLLLGP